MITFLYVKIHEYGFKQLLTAHNYMVVCNMSYRGSVLLRSWLLLNLFFVDLGFGLKKMYLFPFTQIH